jgi:hypothetical protein
MLRFHDWSREKARIETPGGRFQEVSRKKQGTKKNRLQVRADSLNSCWHKNSNLSVSPKNRRSEQMPPQFLKAGTALAVLIHVAIGRLIVLITFFNSLSHKETYFLKIKKYIFF